MKCPFLIVFIILWGLLGVVCSGAERTALIIGNAAYEISPLDSPANDARDMEKALKSYGFDVILYTDASLQQMKTAINTFGKKLRTSKVGLFVTTQPCKLFHGAC